MSEEPKDEATKIEEAVATAHAAAAKIEALDMAQEVWAGVADAAVERRKNELEVGMVDVRIEEVCDEESGEEEDEEEEEEAAPAEAAPAGTTPDKAVKKVKKKVKKGACCRDRAQ